MTYSILTPEKSTDQLIIQAKIQRADENTLVKLIFKNEAGDSERLWARVHSIDGEDYTGTLINVGTISDDLTEGALVHFKKTQVVSMMNPHDTYDCKCGGAY